MIKFLINNGKIYLICIILLGLIVLGIVWKGGDAMKGVFASQKHTHTDSYVTLEKIRQVARLEVYEATVTLIEEDVEAVEHFHGLIKGQEKLLTVCRGSLRYGINLDSVTTDIEDERDTIRITANLDLLGAGIDIASIKQYHDNSWLVDVDKMKVLGELEQRLVKKHARPSGKYAVKYGTAHVEKALTLLVGKPVHITFRASSILG